VRQTTKKANRVVIATANAGKASEITGMLKGLDAEFLTLKDFPSIRLPEETGRSFRENALIKARHVARDTGLFALADDSGLQVKSLSGAPGVYSARYAGKGATDEENYQKLLKVLEGAPEAKREARFVCVIAFSSPDGRDATFEGELRGVITHAPRGAGGFGYDPVFYVPELKKTLAELTAEGKNKVSHRAKALKAFVEWFRENVMQSLK
jgi:XTP/dITP diphosphohydrolase